MIRQSNSEVRKKILLICNKKNGTLIKLYDDNSHKVEIKCDKDHSWETTVYSILKGTWCRICGIEKSKSLRKDSIDVFYKISKERGGKCLSSEYENQTTKLVFECVNGHRFEMRGSVVKRGGWCDKCGRQKKLHDIREKNSKIILQSFNDIVSKQSGEVLGGEYINIKSKFRLKCDQGHEWETTPYLIIKGHWCKKCSGSIGSTKQRGSLDPVLNIIKEKGGKYISGDYSNRQSKIKVECEFGHSWSVRCQGILRGTWCRECYGTSKRNIEEMYQIGKDRGGECLSEEYINDFSKLKWKCSEDHKFTSSPNNIKHGKWCPECSSGIGERICRLYFEKIFNTPFPKVRPDWLKNPSTGRNLEIDGYNDYLKLGFEHHGQQHYLSNLYYSKKHLFEYDQLKKNICLDNDVTLIEVPELFTLTKLKDLKSYLYREFDRLKIVSRIEENDLDISEYEIYTYTRNKEKESIEIKIRERCRILGYQITGFKYDGNIKIDIVCPNNHLLTVKSYDIQFKDVICNQCTKGDTQNHKINKIIRSGFIQKEKLENLQKKKSERKNTIEIKVKDRLYNTKCQIVDGTIENTLSVLNFKCKEGHLFNLKVFDFLRGRGCQVCSKIGKFNFEGLKKYITQKKGNIINSHFDGEKYLFDIKCINGHKLIISSKDIKNNKWCSDCKKIKSLTKKEDKYKKLETYLKSINGKCLSKEGLNQNEKLHFECCKGHTFYSTINNVLYGYWCKICSIQNRKDTSSKSRESKVKKIIKENNGILVSGSYTYGYDDKIIIKCDRGHCWESRVQNILENHWCKRCGLIGRWNKNKITIEEINELVKSKQGRCISMNYTNSKTKLIFECNKGHQWGSLLGNIKKGSWCPKCSRNRF